MRQFSNFLTGLMLVGALLFSGAAMAQTVGSNTNFPTLSAAMAAFPGFENLSNTTITINGNFEVNTSQGINLTWSLDDVEVQYISSTSKITVQPSCTLSATNGCHFSGISNATSFVAIDAKNQSSLTVNACVFDHAGKAISISGNNVAFNIQANIFNVSSGGSNPTGIGIGGSTQDQSLHAVRANTFNLPGKGIVVTTNSTVVPPNAPPATSVRIERNTFQAPTLSSNATGIEVSNDVRNLTIQGFNLQNPVRFINLGKGITLFNNATNVTIDFARSENCMTAIQTLQSLNRLTITNGRFFNCVDDCIRIQAHKFQLGQGPNAPPITDAESVTIQGCRLFSANMSGIRIRDVVNKTGWFNILGNTISPEIGSMGVPPPNAPSTTSHYGISVQNFQNSFIRIEGNTINGGFSQTTAGGIYLQNGLVNSASIIRNNTIRLFEALHLSFAISTANCHGEVQLVGNHIQNVNIPQINYNQGIYMDDTPNGALLCSNDIDRAIDGLVFTGEHYDYEIFCTTFNRHQENALFYDFAMPFGSTQNNHGNCWASDPTATTLDGNFENGGDANAVVEARFMMPMACLETLEKISVNSGGNANQWFDNNAAEPTNQCTNTATDFCGFTPATLVSPDEPEVLGDGDEWAANPQSNVGMDVVHWTAQRNLYGKLVRNPGLVNSSSAISTFYSNGESGNLDKFYKIETGIIGLYADDASSSTIAATLANLQTLNNGITATTDAEGYLKSMFAIKLAALATDDWDFSTSEKASIDNIAAYCPQVGGSAVYLARELQENYRQPDWSMSNCTIPTERSSRLANPSSVWAAFPNPASDLLNLQFGAAIPDNTTIGIFALTGKLVKSIQLSGNEREAIVSLSGIASGSYFVKVLSDEMNAEPLKITIIH